MPNEIKAPRDSNGKFSRRQREDLVETLRSHPVGSALLALGVGAGVAFVGGIRGAKLSDIFSFLVVLVPIAVKLIADSAASWRAERRVLEAERHAFQGAMRQVPTPHAIDLPSSNAALEERVAELSGIVERSRATLNAGLLLDVYNKQIEKYQLQTQSRAGWSFILALIAMAAGLGFVCWSAMVAINATDWGPRIAGTTVSAIGGALSAYITKTFLDVHRLSIQQLNRYFTQPVLNSHILTAQRLADELHSPDAHQEAYKMIIASVITLITAEEETAQLETAGPSGGALDVRRSAPKRAVAKEKATGK